MNNESTGSALSQLTSYKVFHQRLGSTRKSQTVSADIIVLKSSNVYGNSKQIENLMVLFRFFFSTGPSCEPLVRNSVHTVQTLLNNFTYFLYLLFVLFTYFIYSFMLLFFSRLGLVKYISKYI